MGVRTLSATIAINTVANTQGLTKTMSGFAQLKNKIEALNTSASNKASATLKGNSFVAKATVDRALLLKSAQDALSGLKVKVAVDPQVNPGITRPKGISSSSLSPAVSATNSVASMISPTLGGIGSSIARFGGVVGGIVAAAIALKSAIEGIVAMMTSALETTSAINAAKSTIAATIATTKLAGKPASDSERSAILARANREAEALTALMKKYANETALSFKELADTTGKTLALGSARGFSTDESLRLIRDISLVSKGAGLKPDQYAQEVRAIFTGEITSDSTVGQMLQLTTKKMKEIYSKGPDEAIKILNEKMKFYVEQAQNVAMMTFDGTKNLIDTVVVNSQQALGDGFNQMAEGYNKLLQTQLDTPAIGGNQQSSMDELTAAGDKVGAIFGFIYYEVLSGIYGMMTDIAVKINDWFSNSESVADTLSSIWILVETIGSILWDLIVFAFDSIVSVVGYIIDGLKTYYSILGGIFGVTSEVKTESSEVASNVADSSSELNGFESGLIDVKYGFKAVVLLAKSLLEYVINVGKGIYNMARNFVSLGKGAATIVSGTFSGDAAKIAAGVSYMDKASADIKKSASEAFSKSGQTLWTTMEQGNRQIEAARAGEKKAAGESKKRLRESLKENKLKTGSTSGGFTRGKPTTAPSKGKKSKTPKEPKEPTAKELVDQELDPIKKANELKKAQYEIDVANKIKTKEQVAVLNEQMAQDELKQEIALYESKISKLKKIEDIKKANKELEDARHKLKLSQLEAEAKRVLSIENVRTASLTVKTDYLSTVGRTFEADTLARDEEFLKKREALLGTYSEAIARAVTEEDKVTFGKKLADDLALLDKTKAAKTLDAATAATRSFKDEFSSLMSSVDVKANELAIFNEKLDKLKGTFADNAPEVAQIDAFRKLKIELMTLNNEFDKLQQLSGQPEAFASLVAAADSAGLSVKETVKVLQDTKLFDGDLGKQLVADLSSSGFTGADSVLKTYYEAQNKVLDAEIANRQAALALLKSDTAEYKAIYAQLSGLVKEKIDLNAKVPNALRDNMDAFKSQLSTELSDFLQGKQQNFKEVVINSLSAMVSKSINSEAEKLASMFGDTLKDAMSPALDSLKSMVGDLLKSLVSSLGGGGSGLGSTIGGYLSTGLSAIGSYFGISSAAGGAAASAAGAATKSLASSSAMQLPSAGYSSLASLSTQRLAPSPTSSLASNEYTKVSAPIVNVKVNPSIAISQKQQQQMARNSALTTQASINRKS